MYGSSFMFATFRPRFSISAPIDAETIPLPSEDTTPPVTNTNLVCCAMEYLSGASNRAPVVFYRRGSREAIGRARNAAVAITPLLRRSILRCVTGCPAYDRRSQPRSAPDFAGDVPAELLALGARWLRRRHRRHGVVLRVRPVGRSLVDVAGEHPHERLAVE